MLAAHGCVYFSVHLCFNLFDFNTVSATVQARFKMLNTNLLTLDQTCIATRIISLETSSPLPLEQIACHGNIVRDTTAFG